MQFLHGLGFRREYNAASRNVFDCVVGVFDNDGLGVDINILDGERSIGDRRQLVAVVLVVLAFDSEEDLIAFADFLALLSQTLIERSLVAFSSSLDFIRSIRD